MGWVVSRFFSLWLVGLGWVQVFSLVVGWVGSGHTKWTHGQVWFAVRLRSQFVPAGEHETQERVRVAAQRLRRRGVDAAADLQHTDWTRLYPTTILR